MLPLLISPNPSALNTFPFGGTATTIGIVFYVLLAIGWWRIFAKAGYPGILGVIPIVNVVFLVKTSGMSGWWSLLFLVPVVDVVFAIIVALKLGKAFGKGGLFSFFLLFLFAWIGYLIVGFGSAKYRRTA